MGSENLFNIEMKVPNMEEIEMQLGSLKSKTPAVMSRSINRTVTHVSGKIAKDTGKNFAVKKLRAKDVKATLHLKKASQNNLEGEVRSISKEKLKLILFATNPAKPTKKNRANPPQFYQAQLLKNGALKNLGGRQDGTRSKAFVAKMSNGHIGVFERITGAKTTKTTARKVNRYGAGKFKSLRDDKIAELRGPTISSMISSKLVANAIVEDATEFMKRQLAHDIEYFKEREMAKAGGAK